MLILASASPARKALLSGAGLAFEVRAAAIDERAIERRAGAGDAAVLAKTLAEAKALSVAAGHPDSVVIGADQTLALDGAVLHKPAGRDEAVARLRQLRGRTHRLHAGVALASGTTVLWSMVDTAELTMRAFSDAEGEAVLAAEGDAALASVGGYRLEGPSIRLFDTIAGDYFTMLGLPLLPLLAALRHLAPREYGTS